MSTNPFIEIEAISNGLAGTAPVASFWSQLKPASYSKVPFVVLDGSASFGRRNAVHEYPKRDLPWIEDMGRASRRFRINGFLVGDDVIAQRDKLIEACEAKGDGQLVHPTLGNRVVALMDAEFTERWDQGRYFEVQLSFVEQGKRAFPEAVADGKATTASAGAAANAAASDSFLSKAKAALQSGAAVVNQAARNAAQWATKAKNAGRDVTNTFNLLQSLPGAFGRFVGNSVNFVKSEGLIDAVGLTLEGLTGKSVTNRESANAAADALGVAAGSLSAASVDAYSAQALASVAAIAATASTPGDAIRLMSNMVDFYPREAAPASPIGGQMAIMQASFGDLMRRAAVVQLALASSQYQPTSSDDAAAVREQVVSLLDGEIDASGDQGEDDVFLTLRTLRAAVVKDLNARGASLPQMVDVITNAPMPSLALAQRLYQDVGRSDELISESGCIHPAFMPTSFKALSS